MTPPETVPIEVPVVVLTGLLDAINCYSDCCEGNRERVEEAWLLDDDDTGGTFRFVASVLQETVGDQLREIERHLDATNPRLQDYLHRLKMIRKHGEEWTG